MSLLSISLLWLACATFINSIWNGVAPLASSKLAFEVVFLRSDLAGEVTTTSWGWGSTVFDKWLKISSRFFGWFIESNCKKWKRISIGSEFRWRIAMPQTYISCLASQFYCKDETFHCTSSIRLLDKWWGKPVRCNQWSTSTWPIQKLLSPLERRLLNQAVLTVFQRHWWLQRRI